MSAPSLGAHKTYRNDCHVVSRFLSLHHYASFFVFNLCDTYTSSDGVIGNYHPQIFFNQVQRIPFEDHGPPLLVEVAPSCVCAGVLARSGECWEEAHALTCAHTYMRTHTLSIRMHR